MTTIDGKDISHVVVACEAGMGSSVLLTSQLGARLKKYDVKVTHSPVNRLAEAPGEVVLCHQGLADRARQTVPDRVVLPFQLFMGDPSFDKLETAIRDGGRLGD